MLSEGNKTAGEVLNEIATKINQLARVDTLWHVASLHGKGPLFLHRQQLELEQGLATFHKTLENFKLLPQKFPTNDKNVQWKVARKMKEQLNLEVVSSTMRKSVSQLKEQVQVSNVLRSGEGKLNPKVCTPEILGHLAQRVGFEIGSSNRDLFLFTATGALAITVSYPPGVGESKLKVDVTLTMSIGSDLKITKLEDEAEDLRQSMESCDLNGKADLESKLKSLLRRCNLECERVSNGITTADSMRNIESKVAESLSSIAVGTTLMFPASISRGSRGVTVLYPTITNEQQALVTQPLQKKLKPNSPVSQETGSPACQMIFISCVPSGENLQEEKLQVECVPSMCIPRSVIDSIDVHQEGGELVTEGSTAESLAMACLCSWVGTSQLNVIKQRGSEPTDVRALVRVCSGGAQSQQLYAVAGMQELFTTDTKNPWVDKVCSLSTVVHCLSLPIESSERLKGLMSVMRFYWVMNTLITSCIGKTHIALGDTSTQSKGDPMMLKVTIDFPSSLKMQCKVESIANSTLDPLVIGVNVNSDGIQIELDAPNKNSLPSNEEALNWLLSNLSIPCLVHRTSIKFFQSN